MPVMDVSRICRNAAQSPQAGRRSVIGRGLLLAGSVLSTAAASAAAVEEIIVTAQKREERSLEVPVSLTAVNGAMLQGAGVQRLEDLRGFIPNFSLIREPIGDKLNLRGVQSGTQAGFEQSVGTFVDGIYRGRGVQSRFAFLDVDMVEVLRGPQATLFGQNTIAGAVNIRSTRPTPEPEALVSLGRTPEFGETEVQVLVSGPLAQGLLGRVVVLGRRRESGHVWNRFYLDKVPQIDELNGRVTLQWAPHEDTTVLLKAEYGDFATLGQPWELIEGGLFGLFAGEDTVDFITNAGATDPVLDFGANGTQDGDVLETLLGVEHDFRSGIHGTVLLGHSRYTLDRKLDADASRESALRFDDSELFTQDSLELRLASGTGGRFTWLAGAYWQQQDLRADGLTYFWLPRLLTMLSVSCNDMLGRLGSRTLRYATVAVPGNAAATAANVAAGIGEGGGQGATAAYNCAQAALFQPVVTGGLSGISRYALLDQRTQTAALFLRGGLELDPVWSLAAGLRLTAEEKRAAQSVWASAYAPGNKAPSALPLHVSVAQAIGEFTAHAYGPDDPGMTRNDDNVSWSLSLQRSLRSGGMAYAGVSRGYKSGGFNSFHMGQGAGQGSAPEDVAFGDERVLAVETGIKIPLLDGRGELNVALFRNRFEDLQASVFTGGSSFVVQNAAAAVAQGVEFDSRWRFGERFTLNAAAAWLDFGFRDFPNQACFAEQFTEARQAAYAKGLQVGPAAAGIQALTYSNGSCSQAGINDLRGRTSENSPELQASLSAGWRQPLPAGLSLDLRSDLNWRSSVYRQGDLDPLSRIGSLLRQNLSLELEPDSGDWQLALLVRNVTNVRELLFVNDVPFFAQARMAQVAEPRSMQLRGTLRF